MSIIRANGVAGKLSADLTAGGTTMSSAGLADLPVISSPDYAKITLFQTDTNGRVTKQEVVYVTAHSSSSTSATITRGQEGTTGQTWNGSSSPDSWVHAPTASDFGSAGLSSPSTVYTNSGSGAASWTPTGVVAGDLAVFVGLGTGTGFYTPDSTWSVIHDGASDNTGFYGNRTVIAIKRVSSAAAESVSVNTTDASNCWLVMYLHNAASVAYIGFADKARNNVVNVQGVVTTANWPVLSLVSGTTTSGMSALGSMPSVYSTQVGTHAQFCYARLGFADTDGAGGTLTVSDFDHVVYSLTVEPTAVVSGSPTSPIRTVLRTLDATYGDDFTASSLAVKWSRGGDAASGQETFQIDTDASSPTWMRWDRTTAGDGGYVYQTAPAGDFSIIMRLSGMHLSGAMYGPAILDTSGNGVVATMYTSPLAVLTIAVSAMSYASSFTQGKTMADALYGTDYSYFLRLRKSGTSYFSSASYNGEKWQPETPALTSGITVARIGFGWAFGSGIADIDAFNVV